MDNTFHLFSTLIADASGSLFGRQIVLITPKANEILRKKNTVLIKKGGKGSFRKDKKLGENQQNSF